MIFSTVIVDNVQDQLSQNGGIGLYTRLSGYAFPVTTQFVVEARVTMSGRTPGTATTANQGMCEDDNRALTLGARPDPDLDGFVQICSFVRQKPIRNKSRQETPRGKHCELLHT